MYDEVKPDESPESFRYFFMSFSLGVGSGNCILRQRKPPAGDTIDHGFNIAAHTMYLMDKWKSPVVILFWYETTAQRYDEWMRFLNGVLPKRYDFMKQPVKLGVVDGGGEKSDKKSEGLQIVQPSPAQETPPPSA